MVFGFVFQGENTLFFGWLSGAILAFGDSCPKNLFFGTKVGEPDDLV